jgi:hypothetical protein
MTETNDAAPAKRKVALPTEKLRPLLPLVAVVCALLALWLGWSAWKE